MGRGVVVRGLAVAVLMTALVPLTVGDARAEGVIRAYDVDDQYFGLGADDRRLHFGESVAEHDGLLVVGAPGAAAGGCVGADSGVVYAMGTGTPANQTAHLTCAAPHSYGQHVAAGAGGFVASFRSAATFAADRRPRLEVWTRPTGSWQWEWLDPPADFDRFLALAIRPDLDTVVASTNTPINPNSPTLDPPGSDDRLAIWRKDGPGEADWADPTVVEGPTDDYNTNFGHAMAWGGDGTTLYVAAPQFDNGTGGVNRSGAVYVLTPTATSYEVSARIDPPPGYFDFGADLAADGDRLLVRARRDVTNNAYGVIDLVVYDTTTTPWTLVATRETLEVPATIDIEGDLIAHLARPDFTYYTDPDEWWDELPLVIHDISDPTEGYVQRIVPASYRPTDAVFVSPTRILLGAYAESGAHPEAGAVLDFDIPGSFAAPTTTTTSTSTTTTLARTPTALSAEAGDVSPLGRFEPITFELRSDGAPFAGQRVEIWDVQSGAKLCQAFTQANGAGSCQPNTVMLTLADRPLLARYPGSETHALAEGATVATLNPQYVGF